eukprot:TRINITY_DN1442_c1_g1_i1.p1 TRINITY_DN1442_c1_g1~~TRINITY_DN1442_c1_g1_i1.p1  ORF type:complete len:672 (+),score=190.14 TRINITY_DN1442_c1_g1_i1:122-2137(+)
MSDSDSEALAPGEAGEVFLPPPPPPQAQQGGGWSRPPVQQAARFEPPPAPADLRRGPAGGAPPPFRAPQQQQGPVGGLRQPLPAPAAAAQGATGRVPMAPLSGARGRAGDGVGPAAAGRPGLSGSPAGTPPSGYRGAAPAAPAAHQQPAPGVLSRPAVPGAAPGPGQVLIDRAELQRLQDRLASAEAELARERAARQQAEAALAHRAAQDSGGEGIELGHPNGERRHADYPPDLPAPRGDTRPAATRVSAGELAGLRASAAPAQAAPPPAAAAPRRQPSKPERAQPGSQVRVRCVDDAGDGEQRWDGATLLSYEADGTATVCFEDGEVWPKVPVADILPVQEPPASGHSPVTPPAAASQQRGDPPAESEDDDDSLAQHNARQWELEGTWDPSRGLPPSLRRRDIFYTGYLWRKGDGWIRSGRTKQWAILVNGKLYLGNEPTDEEFEALELNGATVTIPGEADWQVVNKAHDVDHTFQCETPSERVLWAARVEVAALQHTPSVPLHPHQLSRFREVFSMRERTVVPGCFGADTLPERAHTTALAGYVIVKTDSGWLSRGDWGRKWVTVHSAWLSIRPDKRKPQGLRVVPLRDCKISDYQIDASNPNNFEITGPFVGSIVISCDGPEHCRKWRLMVSDAIYRTMPERNPPRGHRQQVADLRSWVDVERGVGLA